MKAYATPDLLRNLPELPGFAPLRWTTARVLARKQRSRRPAKRSRDARRASSYDHQLDRIEDLVEGARAQGAVVELERGHGYKRSRRELYVWELVNSPFLTAPRWVRVYRLLIKTGLVWLAENAPHEVGWARRLSRRRAQRNPDATRHSLPRRNWAAFFTYRRVYDHVVRLLLTLDAWWRRGEPAPSREERRALTGEPLRAGSMSPAPRPASPRPKAEERPDADRTREQDGTRYRAHSPVPASYFLALPFPGGAM